MCNLTHTDMHTHTYIYIHIHKNSRQSEISRLTGKHISDTAATVELSCKACFLTLLCGGLSSLWRQVSQAGQQSGDSDIVPPNPTVHIGSQTVVDRSVQSVFVGHFVWHIRLQWLPLAYYWQRNIISVPWTLTSHPTPPQPMFVKN